MIQLKNKTCPRKKALIQLCQGGKNKNQKTENGRNLRGKIAMLVLRKQLHNTIHYFFFLLNMFLLCKSTEI